MAGWAVLLLVLAYASVRRDPATVREQRDAGRALPVLDAAVGHLVAAAGPDAVVEVAAPRVDRGCRVSVVRDGTALTGVVTLRTTADGGPALLEELAGRLPTGYHAEIGPDDEGNSDAVLRADAGEFVAVTGRVTAPGVVELTAASGCRPTPAGFTVGGSSPAGPADAQTARVTTALGVPSGAPADQVVAPCPGGGQVRTVRVLGRGTPGSLHRAGPPAGGTVVVDQPDLYAWRAGRLSVLVRQTDGGYQVTVTTGC